MYDYLCHHPCNHHEVSGPESLGGGGGRALWYLEQVLHRTNGEDTSHAISFVPNTSINKFSSQGD